MVQADAYRVHCAQMEGALAAIRDAVMLDRDGRLERLRELGPELPARVEGATALIEGLHGPETRLTVNVQAGEVDVEAKVQRVIAKAPQMIVDASHDTRPATPETLLR